MPIDPSDPTRIKSAFTADETARRRWGGDHQPSNDRTVLSGRMAKNSSALWPYKAILDYSEGASSDHLFQTMRSGEAFIRSEAPMLPKAELARETPSRAWEAHRNDPSR